MVNKNDKKYLYWIMEQYSLGILNENEFCEAFYYSYNLEIENEKLSLLEKKVFSELSQVVSRFSQYEEDHKLDINAFTTVADIKNKIIESRTKLEQY